MVKALYQDVQCTYCWGDPRFEDQFVLGRIILTVESIKFVSAKNEDSVIWPKASIKFISYAPTHPVDLNEISRTQGLDATQDIAIALNMERVPEPALSLNVQDPEGVIPDGFDIRIIFRNEYYAKVFGKRAVDTFGLSFSRGIGIGK